MAARNSGTKLVVGAVTLTIAAIGVGSIYLPFMVDKDRLRGLDEEGQMYAAEQREYERMVQEMGKAKQQRRNSIPTSNSMWKRMNQQATPKEQK